MIKIPNNKFYLQKYNFIKILKTYSIENILSLSIFAFLIVFFYEQYLKIQYELAQSGWLTGDWLINYSGGFVRRGLIGELARFIHIHFDVELLSLILHIKNFFYAAFLFTLLLVAFKSKLNFFELTLLLSPWALLFDFNDPSGSGRKEVTLFLFFIVFVYFANRIRFSKVRLLKDWKFYYLTFSFAFLTLVHEGLFFFLPIFLIIIMRNKEDFSIYPNRHYEFYIPLLISLILNLVIYFFYKGGKDQSVAICTSILDANLDYGLCKGAISSMVQFESSFHIGYLVNFLPLMILSFFPVLLYAKTKLNKKMFLGFTKTYILIIIFTIPIYYLGVDWGRWIRITAFLVFISLMSMPAREKNFWSISQPIVKFFIIFPPFFYITIWRIPHYIGDSRSVLFINQEWDNLLSTLSRFFGV